MVFFEIILHPAAVCDVMTKQEWKWMREFACARAKKKLHIARRMGVSNNRKSDIRDPYCTFKVTTMRAGL
jgi:hypothetical protein